MTKEEIMEEETETRKWYKQMSIQLVDISESFVGIGKIVINGHSLYNYIEERYKIQSAALPLSLIRSIVEEIAHNIIAAGFKDSYLVLFEDEEASKEKKICIREVCAILQEKEVLRVQWYESMHSETFCKFLKDEHICMTIGYHDLRSLSFLNLSLGLSLYTGVLSIESFRAPRLFMFVMSPSQFNRTLYLQEKIKHRTQNRNALSKELQKESSLPLDVFLMQVLKKYYPSQKVERMSEILSNQRPLRYYPDVQEDMNKEAISEIYQRIRDQPCALSKIIDGALLTPRESPEDLKIPEEQGISEQRPFIPTDMKEVTFYNEEQKKTFRTEQMYIESLKKTAQSLHEGKHLHNPISLVLDKPDKKKKEVKVKISKKQQDIIEQNNKQKEVEAKKKDVAFLKSFLSKHQGYHTVHEKRRHLESFLPRIHSSFICLKVLLLRIEFYMELWTLEKRKKRPSEKDLVNIYMDCMQFIEKYSKNCLPKELEYVLQCMIDQGFISTILEICRKQEISYINQRDPERKKILPGEDPVTISFDPEAKDAPNDFDISFLMRAAGDKLKRSLGSCTDSRLLFEPDNWQVTLLDIVDKNESAVISAPTSSGKTFICYYAIEKVLKHSNDEIVVFVAPTKALVNQVAADVYARFSSKQYIKQNNILQGICMNDFQISPFNCQVLITIPEVLEKIITMPPVPGKKDKKTYLERIRYIIVDEVHKISDSKMGASLEKIIQFSPAPILLLSATLGNLDEFYNWVKSIEDRKGRMCHKVVHRERYCEIKNYIFVPKKITSLEKCQKSTREPGELSLAPIHSLFAYSFRGIKEDGFSDDVNFLPEELLNLYYAIFAVLRKDQRHLVKEFRPQRFFTTNNITKSDVKSYEKHVIETFREMIKNNDLEPEQVSKIYDILIREAKEAFQKIEVDLTEKMNQLEVEKQLKNLSISKESPEEQQSPAEQLSEEDKKDNLFISPDILLYDTKYLLDNILDLTVELESKNMLPSIVFNLERTVCNALAIKLTEELSRLEKSAAPILSKADIRENEKALKEIKRARDATVTTGKDAWISESLMAEEVVGRTIDPDAPDPRFCFTDPSTVSSGAYVLDEYARSLKKSGKIDARLIHALYRGIGVHHSGTPKKYRSMVEILFRMKQLRVIFATETLALGINMPCKSAVFAGDSLTLDAMSFKQMAGRAGRRGYDTQGNVVFFGIPKQKIQSLITSYLPKIKGSYPYTNTLSLQRARPSCPEATETFISFPLMSLMYPSKSFLGTENESEAEYRRRILDEQRKELIKDRFLSLSTIEGPAKSLLEISSLTDVPLSNLSYETETFILMSLIEDEYLEKLFKGDKDDAAIALMNVIAHLFEVSPLTKNSAHPQLKPLPEEIANRIEHYYRRSIELSKRFMSAEEKDLCRVLKDHHSPVPAAFSFFMPLHMRSPKSAYVIEYFTTQKVLAALKCSGMGETELWIHLKKIEDLLCTLVAYYKKYNATSIGLMYVQHTSDLFTERFAKMQA
ncbi:ATP-dependent RNA helicase DDX60 [Nematocida sp. LUAm3]|nr:ATP-dependent RNA helicase DDX60 [Nematocida sp. LUAm3]KAI5175308.1 ATP-dependent RNA helicase DDX60 [Nematocida sp. LUAm2]KAI5177735.1 ATP-dependent RNA helicase DDX60 [Nematocida sp. LUAm1]